jgi:hypothetical protein
MDVASNLLTVFVRVIQRRSHYGQNFATSTPTAAPVAAAMAP